MNKELIPKFPKFYIKAVGGRFSIEHRLTHTYITSVETEKELVAEIKRLNALTEEELWNDLLFKRYASVVSQKDYDRRFSHEEEWYFSAWGIYTSHFYEKYPKLLDEVLVLPYDYINQLRRKKIEDAQVTYKANRERVEEYDRKEKEREKIKEEIIPIGDTKKVEKVIKKKKVAKKLKFKKKPNEVLSMPIISDNPFD